MDKIYRLVELSEVVGDTSAPLFFDTETDGFYGRIELAQFYQEGWEQALLVRRPEPIALYALLAKYLYVAHNAHYDITTVQDNLGRINKFSPNYFDTFFAARVALPRLPDFTLDTVMEYCVGYDPYKAAGLDKKLMQKSKWNKLVLDEDQLLYAAIDVYYLPAVYHKVKEVESSLSYTLDKNTLDEFLDIQQNGLPIREQYVNEQILETMKLNDAINMPINPNSYVQVRNWLGITSSDKEALMGLSLGGDDRATRILDARKYRKRLSYLQKILELVDKDGKLYGKLKVGARSGRATSDQENIQQIPRALKGIVGYEEGEGRVLVFADYAQLELRTICAILQVSLMEKMFREGEDLHQYTADMLSTKRLYAKGANFGLLYGSGIDAFIAFMMSIAGVILDHVEVSQIRGKWRNLWKEIYAWQQIGISKQQKGKLGYTPLGRPYTANRITDYLNIENQGAGAEVAKLATCYLQRKLRAYNEEHGTDTMCINFVHDSFIIDCVDEEEHYMAAAHILAESMQEAWFEMSKLYKVHDLPMPVDVRVGYDWKSIDSDDGFKLYQFELDGMHCYNKMI